MLEVVKLPVGISNLATSLANVDGDALTLELIKLLVHCDHIYIEISKTIIFTCILMGDFFQEVGSLSTP